MLGLKLNHVSKRGQWTRVCPNEDIYSPVNSVILALRINVVRRQTVIWINVGLQPIELIRTNLNESVIKISLSEKKCIWQYRLQNMDHIPASLHENPKFRKWSAKSSNLQ